MFNPLSAGKCKVIESFNQLFKSNNSTFLLQDLDEETLQQKPLLFSHFAAGIGEPKYMAVPGWEELSRLLTEALDNHNEVNAVMNLVLFEDAMSHM